MKIVCLSFALASLAVATAASTQPIPQAVIQDPPSDPTHLPQMIVFPVPDHDTKIPVLFYTASSTGKHPTLILLTGMPGAEMNSDLIYAARREGWNVATFHYRGSWGSGGQFSLNHCIEDAAAVIAWLRSPPPNIAPLMDPDQIAIAGHSFGGWLAGYTAAHDPRLIGAAMISAANMAIPPDTPRADLTPHLDGWIHIQDMQVLNAKTEDLVDEALRDGASWDLTRFADALARHPLLVITSDDGLAPVGDAVAAAVVAKPGGKVTKIHIATNHGYNDRRITLAADLVRWLETLRHSTK